MSPGRPVNYSCPKQLNRRLLIYRKSWGGGRARLSPVRTDESIDAVLPVRNAPGLARRRRRRLFPTGKSRFLFVREEDYYGGACRNGTLSWGVKIGFFRPNTRFSRFSIKRFWTVSAAAAAAADRRSKSVRRGEKKKKTLVLFPTVNRPSVIGRIDVRTARTWETDVFGRLVRKKNVNDDVDGAIYTCGGNRNGSFFVSRVPTSGSRALSSPFPTPPPLPSSYESRRLGTTRAIATTHAPDEFVIDYFSLPLRSFWPSNRIPPVSLLPFLPVLFGIPRFLFFALPSRLLVEPWHGVISRPLLAT